MYYGHMGLYSAGGMYIVWVLFIGIIIWLIIQNNSNNSNKSLDMAKNRLAKGEITKKEFEEIKKAIENS